MAKSKETNTNEQPTAPAVSDVLEDLKAQDFEMVVVVGLDKKVMLLLLQVTMLYQWFIGY